MNPISLLSVFLLQEEKSWLLMSDKVYAVLTVVILIFALVVLYLFRMDKKAKSLEQRMTEAEKSD